MRSWLPLIGLCVALSACDDEEALLAGAGGAGGGAGATGASGASGAGGMVRAEALEPEVPRSMLMVFDTMAFTKVNKDGSVPGFNVDGRVSDGKDEKGCGKPDSTSPEGEKGIDNALAALVPLFEVAGIGAAERLIQDSIDSGGLLLMLQIDDIDDLQNDPEVVVTVRSGSGSPLLGTDSKLLSGQTFHIASDSPESRASKARIENGVLHAGPFDAKLPVVVFGVKYELTLRTAQIRANLTDTGGLREGIAGGGVRVSELYRIGEIAAMDDASVLSAIKKIFANAADLEPLGDEECAQVSAALAFTAVSAYLFPGEPGPGMPKSSP